LERIRGKAVGLLKYRVQTAVAVREVGNLCEMGTMWTVEEGVRCVNFGSSCCGEGEDEDDEVGA